MPHTRLTTAPSYNHAAHTSSHSRASSSARQDTRSRHQIATVYPDRRSVQIDHICMRRPDGSFPGNLRT